MDDFATSRPPEVTVVRVKWMDSGLCNILVDAEDEGQSTPDGQQFGGPRDGLFEMLHHRSSCFGLAKTNMATVANSKQEGSTQRLACHVVWRYASSDGAVGGFTQRTHARYKERSRYCDSKSFEEHVSEPCSDFTISSHLVL